jgi:hypothetical protein
VWLPSQPLSDSDQPLRLNVGEWHKTEPAAHGLNQIGIANERDPVAGLGARQRQVTHEDLSQRAQVAGDSQIDIVPDLRGRRRRAVGR